MKKILIIGLLLFGGYKLYSNGSLDRFPLFKKPGAFDSSGKAVARLFVGPGCDAQCNEIETLLKTRKIEYELVDVSTPEGERYGVRRYPTLQVGDNTAVGGRWEIVGALASNFGPDVLSRSERMAMENHFNESGRAIVVMYGTEWCPYCKKQREYFRNHDIAYTEFDPEKSAAAKTAYAILQGNGYPLTYVGYQRFAGYQGREIKRAVAAIH